MDQELSSEWAQLQDRALQIVRAGGLNSRRGLRVAQFVSMPSFEPNESLEIVEQRKAGQPGTFRLVRTIWRFDLDQAKFADPIIRLKHFGSVEPTIELSAVDLDRTRVEMIRTALGAITVPLPIMPTYAGCDGIFYELRVGEGFTELTVRWWCDPPVGWETLSAEFHQIIEELRGAFRKNGG